MTKASSHLAKDVFRWRYFINAIQDLPMDDLVNQAVDLVARWRWSGPGGWFVISTGVVALLYWNGRLVLATGAGVAVMLLVYLMQDWKPNTRRLTELRKYLQGWNEPFLLSAGAGALATFVTYLAFSVWAESDSSWIATGAILQGMGTLAVLVLLVGHLLHRRSQRDRDHYGQLVSDLTHVDPLKRLIAVRRLTDFVSVLEDDRDAAQQSSENNRRYGSAKKPSRREIAGYFRMMLSRETDPILREAVWDGLQTLDIVYQLKELKAAAQPVVTMAVPHPATKARRVSSYRV